MFNHESFSRILETLVESELRLLTVSEAWAEHDMKLLGEGRTLPRKRTVVLRHDVDAELVAAQWMAEIEAEAGVRATYFFMTQSPIYNIGSRHALRVVRDISSLGHEVGLHHDPRATLGQWPAGAPRKHMVTADAQVFTSLTGLAITSFSIHQPADINEVGGTGFGSLANAYALTNLTYFSDSSQHRQNMDRFAESVRKEDYLASDFDGYQILIHPMWWFYEGREPEEIWQLVIRDELGLAERQLLLTETTYCSERWQAT